MQSDFQSMWNRHHTSITAAKHCIELVNNQTKRVHSAAYRPVPKKREIDKAEVVKMMEQQVFEPVQMEWTAPIVFAPKTDETLRFFVDYKKLNAVTKRDSYPISRMYACMDFLGEVAIFLTMDSNSEYWQKIEKSVQDETIFMSHHGLH